MAPDKFQAPRRKETMYRNLRWLAPVVILAMFAFGPASTGPLQAAPAAAITYNLYATDGYIELPDGGPLYMYGFIGGRQGVDFTYQTSCTPGIVSTTGQPNCTGSTNVPVPGGPVAPTGGPWTGQDAEFAGNAQFPAPIIYAAAGDVVEIRLKNLGVAANPAAPNDPHSIHLHGMDVDAANDGVPETSIGAVPANLCADGTTNLDCSASGGPAPGAGNVIVYMFSPTETGTYMYHCHQEADIHVQMGMYGALVVYNPTDPAYLNGGPGMGYGGNQWGFPYDKDYIMLLSEFDARGHQDEEGTYDPEAWDPDPYNWALYKPQYWMVNGLSFPQTIHVNFPSGYTFSDWVTAHPGYDPLITGSVSTPPNPVWRSPGDKVLIRVINLGFETQPMHMHGFHGKIIGSDQRVWDWANKSGNPKRPPLAFGVGLEKNTLTIGSGETYEWLVDFGQQALNSTYPTGTQTRYDPASNLPALNGANWFPAIPDAGSTDPEAPTYVGGPVVGPGPGDEESIPAVLLGTTIPGQLFPFHNHDDYKATNNGAYPGGMFTMLVTTP
jgi:FtsP/CotA-like multicopper oxidase with cupredoxin domain